MDGAVDSGDCFGTAIGFEKTGVIAASREPVDENCCHNQSSARRLETK